ncbi:MAG: hypothetical protein KF715_05570 [Candidatus Didemnitutus sp.]|nr:hypothetical protein [Candidatus Didemnitutus sp.]
MRIALAPVTPTASVRWVNAERRAFDEWTTCLIDETRAPQEHLTAAHAWCGWALERLGMDAVRIDPPDSTGTHPTPLPGGEAISPQRAVLCLREHLRTAVYLRALDAAVRAAQEKFPGETIHLVEAGCGPAAPMALAMAARYSPAEVQVSLLDIHEASLGDARRLAADLGVERSLRATICGDAAAVRFAENDRPHIVVAEVLRRALKKEPQVAVTRALAPQLRAGGFFLPERIEVDLGFVRAGLAGGGSWDIERLGPVFVLDAGRTDALVPDAAGRLPERSIFVPAHAASALQLLTRLQLFAAHALEDFHCSLTMPERLRGVPDAIAARGGRLRLAYEISADPGVRLIAAEPAEEAISAVRF